MSAVKFSDIIQQFDGSTDFAEWVQKLELVATLQKVGNLAAFLPLFLSGGAFAVYQGLSSDAKADYASVKAALTSAFSLNCFSAYEQFVTRRLRQGESVDVYLAELTKLATLVDEFPSERILKCAFVSGLPADMKRQLLAACSLSDLSLQSIAEKARCRLLSRDSCCAGVAESSPSAPVRSDRRRLVCFTCGAEGHVSRNCQQKAAAVAHRKCHVCGLVGHFASGCPQRVESAKNA
jgi:hypothetical protein